VNGRAAQREWTETPNEKNKQVAHEKEHKKLRKDFGFDRPLQPPGVARYPGVLAHCQPNSSGRALKPANG